MFKYQGVIFSTNSTHFPFRFYKGSSTTRHGLKTVQTTSKRSIMHVAELKGTYQALLSDRQHLSPVQGAAFSYTGGLSRLYDLGEKGSDTSVTCQLVRVLFHKQGEQFRTTENKSKAAYFLTPVLLAKVMHHLHIGNLNDTNVRREICCEWKKHAKAVNGNKTTDSKINALLDRIIFSKNESLAKEYPAYMTETILLGFLYHKATTRQDLQSYLITLNNLNTLHAESNAVVHDDTFNQADIDAGFARIKSMNTNDNVSKHNLMSDNDYETILLALMLKGQRLRQVVMSSYAYQNKKARPNCVEAGFHNLCNILLYNDITNQFDFSQLPCALRPHAQLRSFYQLQGVGQDKLNQPEIGQAYMHILSGNDAFIYNSCHYELKSTIDNFIPVMNFLFGSTATNYNMLSEQFSDDKRQISFNPKHDSISITITSEQKDPEFLTFEFYSGHAELKAKRFHERKETDLDNGARHFVSWAYANRSKYPLLLPVFYQSIKNNDIHKLILREIMSIEQLNYAIIHFFPRTVEEAYTFVCASMPYLSTYSRLHNFISQLLCQFDSVFHHAIYANKLDIIKALIKAGANPNALDPYARTSLHCATSAYNASVNQALVDVLLNAGANPNALDMNGCTPLHHATGIYCANPTITKALLKAGANPNLADKQGLTPLHQAKELVSVQLLLDAGASVNVTDKEGKTPLHYAISNVKTLAVVKVLLKAGANPNAADSQGKTPLFYAAYSRDFDVVEALLKSGANLDVADKHAEHSKFQSKMIKFGLWKAIYQAKVQAYSEQVSAFFRARS